MNEHLNESQNEWIKQQRELLDFLESTPALCPSSDLTIINLYPKTKQKLAELTKALGGKREKHEYGSTFVIRREFGDFAWIDLNASREETCERIQTGTKKVMVVDPAYVAPIAPEPPMIEVEEPVYEWKCEPVLGSA